VDARPFEQADQFRQFRPLQVAQQFHRRLPDYRVHIRQQLKSGLGYLCPHQAAVVPVALLAHEFQRFQPG